MATLAQEMLETPWRASMADVRRISPNRRTILSEEMRYMQDGQQGLEIVHAALRPPTVETGVDGLDCYAERYVMNFDGPDQVSQLVDDGMLDKTVPFDTAEMPAPRVWLEWRVKEDRADRTNSNLKVGVLIEEGHKDNIWNMMPSGRPHDMARYSTRIIACVSTNQAHARILFMGYIPAFPLPRPDTPGGQTGETGCQIGVRWLEGDPDASGLNREIENIVREAIQCLFLLTTPRVTDYREVEFGPKLQHKRSAAGKPPLVEYRDVKLLVGSNQVRARRLGQSAPADSASVTSKRCLHRVVGHFRVYDRDGRKKVIWIPQHLRGDATYGIKLHNRIVEKRKTT